MNKSFVVLIFILLSIANCADLQRNNRLSEITDTKNSLIWEDTKFNANQKQSYKMAIAHCHQLAIKTNQNWHMPSQIEIETILDTSKIPSINDVFKYCANDGYWIESKNSSSVDWIDFNDGNVYSGSGFDKRLYVRCVGNIK